MWNPPPAHRSNRSITSWVKQEATQRKLTRLWHELSFKDKLNIFVMPLSIALVGFVGSYWISLQQTKSSQELQDAQSIINKEHHRNSIDLEVNKIIISLLHNDQITDEVKFTMIERLISKASAKEAADLREFVKPYFTDQDPLVFDEAVKKSYISRVDALIDELSGPTRRVASDELVNLHPGNYQLIQDALIANVQVSNSYTGNLYTLVTLGKLPFWYGNRAQYLQVAKLKSSSFYQEKTFQSWYRRAQARKIPFREAENRQIDQIILYDTQSKDELHELRSLVANKVSWHYLIRESGEVLNLVDERDVAFHSPGVNNQTVAIALLHVSENSNRPGMDRYPPAQLRALQEVLEKTLRVHGLTAFDVILAADLRDDLTSDLEGAGIADIRNQLSGE